MNTNTADARSAATTDPPAACQLPRFSDQTVLADLAGGIALHAAA